MAGEFAAAPSRQRTAEKNSWSLRGKRGAIKRQARRRTSPLRAGRLWLISNWPAMMIPKVRAPAKKNSSSGQFFLSRRRRRQRRRRRKQRKQHSRGAFLPAAGWAAELLLSPYYANLPSLFGAGQRRAAHAELSGLGWSRVNLTICSQLGRRTKKNLHTTTALGLAGCKLASELAGFVFVREPLLLLLHLDLHLRGQLERASRASRAAANIDIDLDFARAGMC